MKEDVEPQQLQKPYIGTWKLVGLGFYDFLHFQVFGEHFPRLDYSNHNVIYEFKENGILVVSGNMDHPMIDWYTERGLDVLSDPRVLTEGSYSYFITMFGISYSGPECYISINREIEYSFRIFEKLSSIEIGFSITGWGSFSLVKVK